MARSSSFYQSSGLNAETYDARTVVEAAPVEGDVEFFLRRARETDGPILELGCGTGRIAWELARAGFQTIGQDAAPAMLELAEAKREDMPEEDRKRLRFALGDMADFQIEEMFGLIFSSYRTFQVLTTPEDQRRCLQCVHRHLRPGGRFIANLFDPRLDWCVPGAPLMPQVSTVPHPVTGHGVRAEVIEHVNDPLRQVLTETWRFTELDDSGKVLRQEDEVLTLRWTYRWEMRYLFQLSGFEVEAEYSDFHESPPAYGKEQVWVVRRR
jgi:SAM-dependent methyltransferase